MHITFRRIAESNWRNEALRTNLWLIPAVESAGAVVLFAVTLSIGVLTSLFSAILVTRLLIVTWLRQWHPKAIPI